MSPEDRAKARPTVLILHSMPDETERIRALLERQPADLRVAHPQLENQTATNALVAAGAHLVLCAPSKVPIWKGWHKRRPSADLAAVHRAEHGPLGVIPWSLRATGLDVDHGDPSKLLQTFKPWVSIPSKRPGGRHAYYDDTVPRANSSWSVLGCRGEVRGGRGYLVLHDTGPELLAAALARRVEGSKPWPCDLFEVAGLPPFVAVREPAPAVQVVEAEHRAPAIDLHLEDVGVGGRSIALFDQVRLWAYRQSKGGDLTGWKERVFSYAMHQNERFAVPIGRHRGDRVDDVASTAWSVASWTWAGGGSLDHGFQAQSRRGAASAKVRRYRVVERDRATVARLDAGQTQRGAAEDLGVSVGTVNAARARLRRPRRAPLQPHVQRT